MEKGVYPVTCMNKGGYEKEMVDLVGPRGCPWTCVVGALRPINRDKNVLDMVV